VESASPHEVMLVEATIDSSFARYAPDKLVGDNAYDSDSLDQQLFKERDVEMIAPHRRRRKRSSTQDGRKLTRYWRQWKVETWLSGCKIAGVWLLEMNTMLRISSLWFSLIALSY